MTPEGKVVAYVKALVKSMGGHVRKCRWEGRVGAPDMLVMLEGRHFWIEAKAPGEEPRPVQLKEHKTMRTVGGCAVYVVDSPAAVDELFRSLFYVDH